MAGRSDFPRTNFGERLKALREAGGLAQEQLAQRASCSTFTVSRLERGAQEPYWPLVVALAKALGVTPNDFLPQAPPAPDPAVPEDAPKAKGKNKRSGD
jgi:transcriptional regulator with XRE-family HTH domain